MAKNLYSFRAGIFSAVALLSIIPGCTRKVYIPVERTLRDTLVQTRVRTDSVLARDSIYVGSRGDTIIKETYRWRWRTKTRTDTVYKTKTDSVPVIVAAAPAPASKRERLIARSITWGTRLAMAAIAAYLLIRRRKREL